jgi:hypothetical protein
MMIHDQNDSVITSHSPLCENNYSLREKIIITAHEYVIND